jgi:DNA mismatch endonuclease, patch repair protein
VGSNPTVGLGGGCTRQEGSFRARAILRCLTDHLSPDERSALMARVGTRDTSPELTLRRALYASGIRGWRCHPSRIRGKPDLAFQRWRIAIFVDGAFWHGHPDYYWGQSGAFWDQKIERNRQRDRLVTAELSEAGWDVIRVWDFEVARDLEGVVDRIRQALDASKAARLSPFRH